ncbi:MAG: hypothetical protein HYW86_05555 [Candidatus Roizmanbacteria bacterium]|nr:MAG: hypothetical protein HYW86_05555 [Candidatus Roizmanbacteria bacterium]
MMDIGGTGTGTGTIKFYDSNVKGASTTTAIAFSDSSSDVNQYRTNYTDETIIGALNEVYAAALGSSGFWLDGGDYLYPNSTYATNIVATTGRIGVGTTNPFGMLQVGATNSPYVNDPNVTSAVTAVLDSASDGGDGYGSGITFNRMRGTIPSPTANQAGDTIGQLIFQGRTDARHSAAAIYADADTGWGATGTDSPGRLRFFTTPDGSSTYAERMRIDNQGNVGIGDASPAYLFTVGDGDLFGVNSSGYALLPAGAATTPSLTFTGDTNTGLYSTAADKLGLVAGGTETMTITNGNVGIGTTNPSEKLVVQKAAITPGTVTSYHLGIGVGTEGDATLTLGADSSYAYLQSWNNRPLQINNQGNNVIFNATGGNVGIGTTSPGEKLEIEDSGAARILIDAGTTAQIYLDRGGNSNADSSINFLTAGTDKFSIGLDNDNTDNFYIANGSMTEANKKVTIDTSGNVGIGTTGPGAKLDVNGHLNVGDTFSNPDGYNKLIRVGDPSHAKIVVQVGTKIGQLVTESDWSYFQLGARSNDDLRLIANNANIMSLTTTGNVGIGTTNPANKLEVVVGTNKRIAIDGNLDWSSYFGDLSTQGPIIRFSRPSDGDFLGLIGTYNTAGGRNNLALSSRNDIVFDSENGTETMRLQTGNVGIGTTAPSFKLEVAGNIGPDANATRDIGSSARHYSTIYADNIVGTGALGYWNRNSTSGYLYPATITDSLGIGTTSPFGMLQVGATNSPYVPALFVNNAGTNVGIGTTAPAYKLDVNGSIRATEADWGAGGLTVFMGATNAGSLGTTGSGRFALTASGSVNGMYLSGGGSNIDFASNALNFNSSAMVLDAGGNLGIGTATPGSKFVVMGGNVGIGTTSPYALVDTNLQIANFTSGNASALELLGNRTTASAQVGQIAFQNQQSTTASKVIANIQGITDGTYDAESGALSFWTANTAGTLSEQVRITSNGNVGIGTTNPGHALDVNGAVNIAINTPYRAAGNAILGTASSSDTYLRSYNDDIFFQDSSGNNLAAITDTGNLGIGTTTPTTKLSFAGSADGYDAIDVGGTAGKQWGLYYDQGSWLASLFSIDEFSSDGSRTPRLTINNGNVGIGTTAPSAPLHVWGTNGVVDIGKDGTGQNWLRLFGTNSDTYIEADSNDAYFTTNATHASGGWTIPGSAFSSWAIEMTSKNTSGEKFTIYHSDQSSATFSERFVIDENGNVGIGATNPSSFKLEVAGNIGPDANATRDIGSSARHYSTIYADNIVGTGALGYWNRNSTSGYLYPATITDSLGIGTTSPFGMLQVGATNSPYVPALFVNNAGTNVGIGTTNPTSSLQIAGSTPRIDIGTGISGDSAGILYIHNYSAGQDRPMILQPNGSPAGIVMAAPFTIQGNSLTFNYHNGSAYVAGLSIAQTSGDVYIAQNGGNVGIGTTGPDTKLHLYETSGALVAKLNSTDTTSYQAIALLESGTGSYIEHMNSAHPTVARRNNLELYNQTATGGITFHTANNTTPKMVIDYLGNVGIGTTAPNAPLEVVGNLYGTGLNDQGVYFKDSTTAAQNVGGSILLMGKTGTGDNYATYGEIHGGKENATAGNYASYLNFATRADGGAVTEQMRINSNGNVGIGTTAPAAKLQVAGDHILIDNLKTFSGKNTSGTGVGLIGIDDGNAININRNGAAVSTVVNIGASDGIYFMDNFTTYNMTIKGTGNVGIGTDTTPDYLLELYDATNTPTFALSDDDVAHSFTDLANADTFAHLTSLSTTAGGALFQSFSDGDASGFNLKVGIGTTDPTDSTPAIKLIGGKLSGTTLGDLAATETVLQIANNDDAAALTILGNGNVGIGTTNPSSFKLEVAGNIGPDANATRDIGSSARHYSTIYADNIVGTGALGYWSRNSTSGYLYPATITDSLGIGTTNPFGMLQVGATNSPYIPALFVNSAGTNVGIGTTGPSALLHLYKTGANADITLDTTGDADRYNRLYFNAARGSNGQTVGQLSFNNGGATPVAEIIGIRSATATTGFLSFFTSNSEAMRISSTGGLSLGSTYVSTDPGAGAMIVSGNVGIGTTGPTYKLDVSGTARINSTTSTLLDLTSTQTYAQMQFIEGSTTRGYFGYGDSGGVLTNALPDSMALWGVNGLHLTANVDAALGMTITTGGNVGIGTTSPGAILAISAALSRPTITSTTTTNDVQLSFTNGGGSLYVGRDNATASSGSTFLTSGGLNYAGVISVSGLYPLQLATNSISRVTIDSTGNVGIGTTSPQRKLDILDASNPQTRLTYNAATYTDFQTDISGHLQITPTGDQIDIRGTTHAYLNFYRSGTNKWSMYNWGSTSPLDRFFLTDQTGSVDVLTVRSKVTDGAGQVAGITMAQNFSALNTAGDGYTGLVLNVTDAAAGATGTKLIQDWQLGGASKMVLTSIGNVGIGTTNPGGALELATNITGATAVTQYGVKINPRLTGTLASAQTNFYSEYNVSTINVGGTSPNLTNLFGNYIGASVGTGVTSTVTNYYGLYLASPSTSGSGTITNKYALVTEGNAGNVGIGTTAPGAKLDILGASSPTMRIVSAAGTVPAYMDGQAYKGLYITTPSGSGDYPGIETVDTLGVHMVFGGNTIGTLTNTTLRILTNSGDAINILGNGNVGINTGAPLSKLGVLGNAAIGATYGAIAAPTSGLIVEGNVGIGTTDPSSFKLEVAGDVGPSADNTYDLGSTAKSWQDLYLTGNLCFDDTDCINGSSVGGGWQDLGTAVALITQTDNVGIGTTAPLGMLSVGATNTSPILYVSSAGNVGIGTTNPQAPFVVAGSGYSNVEIRGSANNYNAYVGANAGKAETTGGSNAFFGAYAGQLNTSGYGNTYIGGRVAENNTDQWGNTFVGSWIFASGNNATIIGDQAGYASSGNNTAMLGYQAGYGNNGNNNVILGYQAGYNGDGASNVFLGYQAGYNETGSNKLYVANSDTTSLLYGDFSTGQVGLGGTAANTNPSVYIGSNGNVGIGTTGPEAKLEVSSTNDGGEVIPLKLRNTGTALNTATSLGFLTTPSVTVGAKIQALRTDSPQGGDTGFAFYTLGSATLAERVRIQPSGNVGIGATVPNAPLQISTAEGNSMALNVTTPAGADYDFGYYIQGAAAITAHGTDGWLRLNQNSSFSSGVYTPGRIHTDGRLSANGSLSVGSYANTDPGTGNVIISGNVGIGTSVPSITNDNGNTGSFLQIRGVNDGNLITVLSLTNRPGGNASAGTGARLRFSNHANSYYGVDIGSIATQADPGYPNEAFTVRTTYNSTTWAEKFRITADGNVGIGTTSPFGMLQVGATSTPYTPNFFVSASASGNVGIGTTNPMAGLQISKANADYKGQLVLVDPDNNGDTNAAITAISGYGKDLANGNSTGRMWYLGSTGGSDKKIYLYNHLADDLLLGTAPSSKLQVVGSTQIRGNLSINALGSVNNGRTIDFVADNDGVGQIYSSYWSTEGPLVLGTYTNRANQLSLTTSGSVGIGITAPLGSASSLELAGGELYVSADTSATRKMIFIDHNGTLGYIASSYAGSGAYSPLGIRTSGLDRIYIETGGNVSIGTTNPSSFKLEVAGDAGPSADDTYDLGSTAKSWQDLYLTGNLCFDDTDCINGSSVGGGWQDLGTAVALITQTDNQGINSMLIMAI